MIEIGGGAEEERLVHEGLVIASDRADTPSLISDVDAIAASQFPGGAHRLGLKLDVEFVVRRSARRRALHDSDFHPIARDDEGWIEHQQLLPRRVEENAATILDREATREAEAALDGEGMLATVRLHAIAAGDCEDSTRDRIVRHHEERIGGNSYLAASAPGEHPNLQIHSCPHPGLDEWSRGGVLGP